MKDARRFLLPHAGLLCLMLALFLGGGQPDALAQTTCPNPDRTLDYNCPVGPTYLIPGLTDVNGWNQPAHYENILTGDITGDGVDELVARGPMGIVVYRFDTKHGQWSQVSVDPILSDKDGWGQPKYYSTIQLVRLFPPPDSTKLIARSSDGIVVYEFEPGATPDTGSWNQLSTSGPLGDKSCFSNGKCWGDDPSYYSTIQVGDLGAGVTNRLVARGADGLVTYEWDGSKWNPLPTLSDFSDANGWNKPEYYSTIRVWSNGEILLARGPAGMLVYQLEPVGGTPTGWQKVGTSGPFADNDCFANGKCWNSGPQYYSTIQLAPNPGAGDPLVIGRGGDGVEYYIGAPAQTGGPWVWQALRDKQGAPFSDAAGFDKPEYYRTIRIANFGGGFDQLELLGRGPTGVTTFNANPSQQSGPWGAPLVAGEPVLADDPWAKCACYYDTFRTADVTGSDAHVLLARGTHGIRTWRFNKQSSTWTRYQPYGNYPAVDHAAYDALNTFLGLSSDKPIRSLYTDPTEDHDATELQGKQNAIAQTCSNPSGASPPQYQTCTPPPGASGIPATAWTAVSNQIIAELFWAVQVIDHFDAIKDINTQLWLDEDGAFPAIGTQLNLGQASNVEANVDYFTLMEEAFSLASLIPFIGEALQGVFEVTSAALGIAGAATDTGSGTAPSRFDHKFAEMQAHIATIRDQTQDANLGHKHFVLGDYGLLQAVGHLVAAQVWTLNAEAMLSAGRQSFNLWAYNGLLPVLWDRWNVTDCFPGNGGGAPACQAPQNGAGMKSYSTTNGSTTFDGLVPTQRPCDHQFINQHCVWASLETQDYANALKVLRGAVTTDCIFDPAAGHAWEYGCSLGQEWTDLEATDASGSPRWPFDKRSCLFRVDNQDCYNAQPSSVQRGELRGIGTRFSSLALTVAEPLSDSLDLRNATVTLGHLLHEVGGAGELVNDANGADLAPRVHTVRSSGRNAAIFQSSPRETPRILGLLSVSGGNLRVSLQIGGAPLDGPQLCGSDGISHLHTHLLVDDGVNRPVQTLITVPWQCITDGKGVVRNLRVPR